MDQQYVVYNEHTGTFDTGPMNLDQARKSCSAMNAEHQRRQAHYGIRLTERYFVTGYMPSDRDSRRWNA